MEKPSEFRVRFLTSPSQLSMIRELDQLIFPKHEIVEAYDDTTYASNKWWVVYNRDSQPIAYAGARIETSGLYLERTGVLPLYRGKGLQKRLIAARVQYAKREGIPLVYTYCAHWNVASANALISQGFKLYNPNWRYAGEVDDATFLYFYRRLECSEF